MNFEKIYEYRFKDVKDISKISTWEILSSFLHKKLSCPEKIIDPAAGMCEFINAVPSKEKWAVDLDESFLNKHASNNVKKQIGNALDISLPDNYFDAVFISNFLEHLDTQDDVAVFLSRMHKTLKDDGKIAIMGPNFKYCYKNYFDFADHKVILTEMGLAEHLYGAGFEKIKIIPRFLPLTFRSKLPPLKAFVKLYLLFPIAWKFFGKQFLLIAEKNNN
ncbi:MAG: class I SAM-dependent methyltransferase [Bacteroidales bacterium]|nr:class I SAM-dependent methyltransferase [Bacteroidales bacterium]